MIKDGFEICKEFFELNGEPKKKTYYEAYYSATGALLVEEKECGETANFYFFYEDMHSGYASGHFKGCNIVFKNFFITDRWGDNENDISFKFQNERGCVFFSYNAMIQYVDFLVKKGQAYRFVNFEKRI